MSTYRLMVLVFALVLGACATKRTGTFSAYDSDNGLVTQTALIRPATQDEKLEEKASLAVRLFVNRSGQGSVAQLLSISRAGSSVPLDLKAYEAVRVPLGEYSVRAQCFLPSFHIFFDVPIFVSQGGVYLLECTGNTAHTARISYRLVPPN